MYGAQETNGLTDAQAYHESVDRSGPLWTFQELQAAGGKVTRLRLLSDPGFPFWDVSYCHGTLPDGRIVPVQTTFFQLPKRNTIGAIINDARVEGYYAQRLGLLDRSNWSTLN
jgi:hypothetical protein